MCVCRGHFHTKTMSSGLLTSSILLRERIGARTQAPQVVKVLLDIGPGLLVLKEGPKSEGEETGGVRLSSGERAVSKDPFRNYTKGTRVDGRSKPFWSPKMTCRYFHNRVFCTKRKSVILGTSLASSQLCTWIIRESFERVP